MLEALLPSFASEFVKIATSKSMTRANAFHKAEVKDWPGFEKDLHNRFFQQAMLKHDLTDPKLKKYVKNYGGSLRSKSIIAFAPSRTEKGREYKIKVLPTGRLSCECGDWQYHHSVRKSDCDHIKAVRHFYKAGLVKAASVYATMVKGMNLKRRADMARISLEKGKMEREHS